MKYFYLFTTFLILCCNVVQAQTYADIPGPENVLVVYNELSTTSIAIKNYYQNARGIPESNIVHLDSLFDDDIYDPETQTWHSIELRQGVGNEKEIIYDTQGRYDTVYNNAWIYFIERIAIPIANKLKTTNENGDTLKNIIRFIVLSKGIPFRIQITPFNTSSSCNQNVLVDALLYYLGEDINDPYHLLDYLNEAPTINEQCQETYNIKNPYYNADPNFSMDYNFIPNYYSKYNSKLGRDITLSYLITHLDAPSFDIVKNMIDSSIAAINSTNYDWFIDSDPSPCAGSSQILHPSGTEMAFNNLGIANYFIDNSNTVDTTHYRPVMSYSSNGIHTSENPNDDCDLYFAEDYIQTQLDFTYIAGSVFNTAESFNARTIGIDPLIDPTVRAGQGLIPEFFIEGGTVGVGQVYHGPGIVGGIVIDNSIMFPSYALGYSFIEAAYLGMQYLTSNRVVVGDPLTIISDYFPIIILSSDSTLTSGDIYVRIIVPEGITLTIASGTVINIERNGSLRVEGTLIVKSNAVVNFNTYSELRILDTGFLTTNAYANINFSAQSIFNVSGIANINDNAIVTLNDDTKFNNNGTVNINNSEITFNDDTEFNINKNLYTSGATLSFNNNSSFDIFFKMEAINSTFNFETNTKYFTFQNKDTLIIDNGTIEKGNLITSVDNLNDIAFVKVINSTYNSNRTPITINTKLNQDLTVIIEGNEFNNSIDYSVSAVGVKELTISKNEINGNQNSDGIHLENNGAVVIDSNVINYTATGIKTIERVLEALELGETQTLLIKDNIIANSGTGIQLSDPSNYISSAELKLNTINNGNDGIVLNNISSFSPGLKGNTITNSTNQGISITNVDDITIQNNSVTNTGLGINLANVTNAHIINNVITSSLNIMPGIFLSSTNGELRGNTISGHTNGIHLGNSSPDIGDNTITDNLYHGIYIGSGSLPNMVGKLAGNPPLLYPIAGYNDIFDNGGWDDPQGPNDNDGSEIFISNANTRMDKGCNSITDDRAPGGNLINTKYLMGGESFAMPIQVNAEYNFWGNNPLYPLLDARFNSLIVYYNPIYNDPCTLPQGGSGGSTALFVTTSNAVIIDTLYSIDSEIGDLSTTELLYAAAEEKFLTADYESAEVIYNQIINSSDTLFAKLEAYRMLYNLGRLTNKNPDYFSDLKTVYFSLSQSATDSLQQKIFSQLASLSLVGQTEFVSAIEEFDAVVQQNQGTEEALYAEIDALTTALLLAPDSSLGKGILGKYAVIDISDYTNRVSNLLKQRGENSNYKKEPVPTEYALYQNYPNPFNPSTIIKYAIVKTSKVKLAVYDILGREVIVLADEVKEPGFYEVNFDASYLSSGVYFYRIVTGDYVNTKKMLMIK